MIPITMTPIKMTDAYGGSYVGLFANDEQPEEDAPQEYAEEEVEDGKLLPLMTTLLIALLWEKLSS